MLRISLRTVVISGVIAGLALPMTVGTWYSLKKQNQDLSAEAAAAHERAANVLAIGVSKALWDLSPEGATPLVKSVFDDGRIVHAQVLDAKGEVFYEEKDEARRAGEIVTLEKPVANGEEVIGKVKVEFSLASAAAQIQQRIRDAIVLSLLQAGICIAILLLVINSRLLRPISRIRTQAELIAQKSLDTPLSWVSNDEMGDLARALETTRLSLRELFGELERKNADLAAINGNLEKIVEERTATIKLILDHVQSGFLLIDRNQTVLNGYTKSCRKLLDTDELAGKSLGEVLQLDEEKQTYYQACIEQIYDDFMPEDVTLSQMPRRFKIGNRSIAVDGSTVRNASGVIEKILFTIVDISALDQVEAENRANRAMVNIMRNITAFKDFVEESRERLENAVSGVERGEDALVRRELHTLKGNSSAFGLERIAGVIHQIEDQVDISKKNLEQIEGSFSEFLEAHYNLLKVKFGQQGEPQYSVTETDVMDLMTSAERGAAPESVKSSIVQWVNRIRMVRIQDLLGPLENYVTKLAADRGKSVEIVISGGTTRVNPTVVKSVLHNLIHLVRNSIDHGIEAPEDRGTKSPTAKLELAFRASGDRMQVRIADDRRGIDTRKITAKAVELGILSRIAAENIGDSEALELIYSEGLSTAASVTDTSGRGVGMNAVRAAVHEAGGTMKIETKLGLGTAFTIDLPIDSTAAIKAAA